MLFCQVWHRPEWGHDCDVLLGVANIDLAPLVVGLPAIDGWFVGFDAQMNSNDIEFFQV